MYVSRSTYDDGRDFENGDSPGNFRFFVAAAGAAFF